VVKSHVKIYQCTMIHRCRIPSRSLRQQQLYCYLAFSFSVIGRSSAAFALPASSRTSTAPSLVFSSASAESFASPSDDYSTELPPSFPRRDDVIVALAAVRKACAVTLALQPESKDGIATVSKQDLSPVTVGTSRHKPLS
jgi:hypothetical protein